MQSMAYCFFNCIRWMLEQYLPTEICTRKYIHDITKWFCCEKKRILRYHLMILDHRIVVSKVL